MAVEIQLRSAQTGLHLGHSVPAQASLGHTILQLRGSQVMFDTASRGFSQMFLHIGYSQTGSHRAILYKIPLH